MAEKIFTVKHFKEIVKPALSQRPIYIRKDENELYDNADVDYAQRVAEVIPLIRVGNYVIHRDNINSFSIEVGKTLLPIITFNFDDEAQRCRRMLTAQKDLITVYYGNTVDEYYIKQEYILSDIFADPDSDDIQLTGYLYVPELYKQHIRYFNEETNTETTWKIIKKICEECSLGFFTNIDETDDAQTWIQDNCTTLEFLQNTIIPHAYVSDDTKLIFYIDQYDYLNVVDLKKAYTNRELEKTSKYPLTGISFENNETKDIILTSGRWDNKDAPYKNSPFNIASYTTNFRYGSRLGELPDHIDRNEYSLSELPFKIESSQLKTNTHEVEQKYYITKVFSDVHKHYNSINYEKPYLDMHYDQGDEIEAKMVGPIMLLYPYMYVPVKLFTKLVRPEYDDAEKDSTPTELDKEKPSIDEIDVPDELHSGDYLIQSIRYECSRYEEQNVQYITLTRLPLKEIPKIKQR